jgi:hypothetical protein
MRVNGPLMITHEIIYRTPAQQNLAVHTTKMSYILFTWIIMRKCWKQPPEHILISESIYHSMVKCIQRENLEFRWNQYWKKCGKLTLPCSHALG